MGEIMDFTNLDKKYNEMKLKMEELESYILTFEPKNYKDRDEADVKIREIINLFNSRHDIFLREMEILLNGTIKHFINNHHQVIN